MNKEILLIISLLIIMYFIRDIITVLIVMCILCSIMFYIYDKKDNFFPINLNI